MAQPPKTGAAEAEKRPFPVESIICREAPCARNKDKKAAIVSKRAAKMHRVAGSD
jgi:hypothetical protein